MRGSIGLLAACAVLLAAGTTAGSAVGAAPGPKLVCLTDFDGNTAYGAYKYRPKKCIVHERGEPFVGYTLVGLRRLHWKSWSGQARGSALIRGNMGYKAKAKLKLLKPRSPCGTTVFSLMKIHYRNLSEGETGSSRIHLDTCLR